MTDREQILEIVRRFSGYIPFNKFLGLEFVEVRPGHVTVRLPFKAELIGDPQRPALHGGVLASAIDSATGAAVWTLIELGDVISTIDMRVDYLRPGRAETLLVEARVVRTGRHVAVASARAFHESQREETVAEGRAVFSIKRGKITEKLSTASAPTRPENSGP